LLDQGLWRALGLTGIAEEHEGDESGRIGALAPESLLRD